MVFFVVPAILLVACGAPTDDGAAAAAAAAKAASKLPAEKAPATWDAAFEHMLTALHAPYSDGDCFFKSGTVIGVAPTTMKIMGKNLVVHSTKKFKAVTIGTGHFSITTIGTAAGAVKIAVASAAGAAATAGVLIEYKNFKPAGSNVMIDGKIGLNGVAAAADSNLVMFAPRTADADTNPEAANGGTLKIKGPGYTAELSFTKLPHGGTAPSVGEQAMSNFRVTTSGKDCDAGAAAVVAAVATDGPFAGAGIVGNAHTGGFAKFGAALINNRIIVKFKFNNEEKTLVGTGAEEKGQDLMKSLVKVTKAAPAAVPVV